MAPADRAAYSFCWIPPIGPTLPLPSMVPVPAIRRPPVMSSGVSLSTMPRANISPALGPPTLSSWMRTVNGYWASSRSTIPTIATFGSSGAARVVRVSSWVAPPRRTVKRTASPGVCRRTSWATWSSAVTVVPSTATTTSPFSSRPWAGEPATTESTTTWVVTG